MKEVGDKFGAGELILPFVLQSAEVMKRAVAQLENYLDRIDGHTKGKVVIATVFGDVHDIGKSLVNTILTNNGYTVIDLGKQVPIDAIIEAAVENDADAIGLSALLVSTSKQMPACIQELHQRGLEFPVLIGGAAINRDFGRRTLYPKGNESDEVYEPGVFYCKDAFEGLDTMDALVDEPARRASVERIRAEAKQLREKPVVIDDSPPVTDDSVRSAARTDTPIPSRPSGAREDPDRPRRRLPLPRPPRALQAALGGRGVSGARPGASWSREPTRGGLCHRGWADVARAGLPPPPRPARLLPVQLRRQRAGRLRPGGSRARARAPRLPRQPKHDRICRPTSTARSTRRTRRRRPAGVTVGPEVTELIERLEQEGEFAEQLFVHGLGVQSAEGLAEWLHADARRELGIDLDQGRRYSWGYPACPDQSEHEKVWRLLGLEEIGMTLSDGYAVTPEQSTVAIVAHHPQAVYFGMKSGFIPEDKTPDETIAGTDRGEVSCRPSPTPTPPRCRAPSGGRSNHRTPRPLLVQLLTWIGGEARKRWRRWAWSVSPTCRAGAASARAAPERSESLHPEVAPGEALADQRRQAERDRGGDLDRLQDDAVGEGVGGADAKPVCRTLITASWKTPMFDGVAGTTAVTLTANRTAAAAPIPAWSSRPSA